MYIHPAMQGKMKTFVYTAFFDCLCRIRITCITYKYRSNIGIHMIGSDIGLLHAFFVAVSQPFMKKIFCEMIYIN